MAGTSSKRLTRLDRENASAAARSYDLGPLLRGGGAVISVVLAVFVVSLVIPDPAKLGGPLQPNAAPTLATVRKVGGDRITITISVPWNAGIGVATLEALVPVGIDGLQVEKTGVLPAGVEPLEPTRGFPPLGLAVLPVDGYGVDPGSNALDGFQVAIGLRGTGSVLGFALRYRVGDETFTAFVPAGAMLCGASCDGKAEVAEEQRGLAAGLAGFIDAPAR